MPPLCPKCGRPQTSGVLYPSCISWQAMVDGIRSPFRFDGVIRLTIYQLKYRNLRTRAVSLAGLLNDYLNTNHIHGEVLVPVPMHPKRLRERGYNQSSLLAQELGKITGLQVVNNCHIRCSIRLSKQESPLWTNGGVM
jgi:predicted amidophosphoribosyltransferase